jgi:hypothetical protein
LIGFEKNIFKKMMYVDFVLFLTTNQQYATTAATYSKYICMIGVGACE